MQFDISNIEIDNDNFLLMKPIEVLTDNEYDNLKPMIESMGGHWRERVKGFIFSKDILLKNSCASWKEENQFFPTPQNIAKRVVELAEINEKSIVLEPSAGTGALLDNLLIYTKLYVVEPYYPNIQTLKNKKYDVIQSTFENFFETYKNEKITNIIMNPPFSKQRDIKHILMAYELLEKNGVLVAIMSENSLYYNTELTKNFNLFLKEKNAYIENIPYGSFKESGTTVDTVIVKIKKD